MSVTFWDHPRTVSALLIAFQFYLMISPNCFLFFGQQIDDLLIKVLQSLCHFVVVHARTRPQRFPALSVQTFEFLLLIVGQIQSSGKRRVDTKLARQTTSTGRVTSASVFLESDCESSASTQTKGHTMLPSRASRNVCGKNLQFISISPHECVQRPLQ